MYSWKSQSDVTWEPSVYVRMYKIGQEYSFICHNSLVGYGFQYIVTRLLATAS